MRTFIKRSFIVYFPLQNEWYVRLKKSVIPETQIALFWDIIVDNHLNSSYMVGFPLKFIDSIFFLSQISRAFFSNND